MILFYNVHVCISKILNDNLLYTHQYIVKKTSNYYYKLNLWQPLKIITKSKNKMDFTPVLMDEMKHILQNILNDLFHFSLLF